MWTIVAVAAMFAGVALMTMWYFEKHP